MKKIILGIFILLMNLTVPLNAEEKKVAEPQIKADAAVLIDAKTGQILYAKNADKKEFPASITKIMTVYLAAKLGAAEDKMIVSKEAVDSIDRKSSHIFLDDKEELSLKDAMYASLMASANDASNVIAEKLGGTIEQFVQMMNEAAKELNAVNTHFSNAHGLPAEDHKTTAYDMALITQAAIKNDTFKKIFGEITYEMDATNKSKARVFATGSELLKGSENKYEFATGGKIGWTLDAGYTMVSTAKKGDLELIVVVLKCSDSQSRYDDTKNLFEYGFGNFKTFNYAKELVKETSKEIIQNKKVIGKITFNLQEDFNFIINSSIPGMQVTHKILYLNEEEPEAIEAYLTLYYQDAEVGKIKLDATLQRYDLSFKARVLPYILNGIDFMSLGVLGLFVIIFGWDRITTRKRKRS